MSCPADLISIPESVFESVAVLSLLSWLVVGSA